MNILSHNDRLSEDIRRQKCTSCGMVQTKLFSRKFKSGAVCSDCLWEPVSTGTKAGKANEDSAIEAKESERKVQLYICFGCNQLNSTGGMSSCLLLCKECLGYARDNAGKTGSRFVEKSLLRVEAFIRRRI